MYYFAGQNESVVELWELCEKHVPLHKMFSSPNIDSKLKTVVPYFIISAFEIKIMYTVILIIVIILLVLAAYHVFSVNLARGGSNHS